jgi:hypothetical protein
MASRIRCLLSSRSHNSKDRDAALAYSAIGAIRMKQIAIGAEYGVGCA